ncbi:hypothetical protein CAI21_00445 [Alkalilimnicola ehrlichii]|uniref:Nucleotidyltransferase n=1 Tax=Alkalilimnicola ehrlichii TaxID=351052 RepID=A0A3E0X496_9GAMM|nr:hypothetical protein [Alkalilimnicola ehrlichii]RFA31160.1 hypothetical protein CAI21_00445 [Alkalilimnicola ehrlichii]RFA39554.1 hypothetical protein CAL65_01960 [Alkalilimnicola ehrlichii]
MAKKVNPRDERMRQRLTLEAARIMAEEGVSDYAFAKRKAAERIGAPDTRNLPGNREIQDALADYQRLFQAEDQPARVRYLREQAVAAMEFFSPFRPRLVGSVLNGTASQHSDVNLHVFADTPEEVVLFLMEHNIPFETAERRLRFGREDYVMVPVFRFAAGDVMVDLTVFEPEGLREAPRSRVDGQPMQRANLPAVRELLSA